jgi:hypothetical protein
VTKFRVYRVENISRSRECVVDAPDEESAIAKAKAEGTWDNFDENDLRPEQYSAYPDEDCMDFDAVAEEEEEEDPPPPVQHIRKDLNVVAEQLRGLADSIDSGRTKGIFVVHIDHHRRRDLIVYSERYSIVELMGDTELELLNLKMNLLAQKDDG